MVVMDIIAKCGIREEDSYSEAIKALSRSQYDFSVKHAPLKIYPVYNEDEVITIPYAVVKVNVGHGETLILKYRDLEYLESADYRCNIRMEF